MRCLPLQSFSTEQILKADSEVKAKDRNSFRSQLCSFLFCSLTKAVNRKTTEGNEEHLAER